MAIGGGSGRARGFGAVFAGRLRWDAIRSERLEIGAGPRRAASIPVRASSSVVYGPRTSGNPSSFVCSASLTIQPPDACSTVNRPSTVT